MSKKYKRPSSARRNIKQEEFSVYASLTRLRRVQSLLVAEDELLSTKPDSILCISGIDGRYNEGTQELINHLLFGFFALRKYEIERSGFEEETVDDLVILIRKRSVDVYCNPINYMYLLPYIAHWRNLRIHCMTDKDYENEEKAEDFKISSFVSMTHNCRHVAIPYSSSAQFNKFDIMQIEKWPIVQAFALEGVGGGGFFTMKYECTDISELVHNIYHQLDPVSLESVIKEQLSLFERQWDTMLSIIDVTGGDRLKDLKALTLCEPLKSYYKHGRVTSARESRREQAGERRPFLLIGSDTQRHLLAQANTTGQSSTEDFIMLGTENSLARHMVCQAVSPKGPLCCRRTYFFSNGVLPHPVFNPAGEPSRLPEKSDIKVIIQVYSACIDALLVAIHTYATTRSYSQAQSSAMESLLHAWEAAAIPVSSTHLHQSKNIEFKIEAFNNHSQKPPLSNQESELLVKTASITVYDLPSIENPHQTLGSVSFAEAFVESVLNVQQNDGSVEPDSEVTILTSNVPRFISWPASLEEHRAVKLVEEQLQSGRASSILGELLIRGQETRFVREGDRNLTIPNGRLYMYERGIVYQHPHHGVIVIPKQEISALHFYDGDSPSVVAILVVSYKENIRDYLPLHLRCRFNRFILAFLPKSKAYKLMFTEVLPVWKDKDEVPPLQRIEEIPEELEQIHKVFQDEYKVLSTPASSLTPLKKAMHKIEGLRTFLPHFEGSSVTRGSVPSKHVSIIAGREYDEGSFGSGDQLIVSIIGGVEGSGKTALGQHLSKFAKEEQNWAVIKQAVTSTEGFSSQNLQLTLAHTWQAIKKRRRTSQGASKLIRVLVITPGYTDTVDVIQSITSIPDKDVARHIKIGAVTVCIDPDNAYMCDRATLPKLLDQCAQGWVNNIVFTTHHAQNHAVLDQLQTTIRALNSDVALLLAPDGEITRSTDIDLLLSTIAFNNQSHIRSRYLSCPGWWKGEYDSGLCCPEIVEMVLRFSQPLDKSHFLIRLKGLKSAQTKFPYHGNIYNVRGKIVFQESTQVYELRYTVLSNILTLNPVELKPSEIAAAQNGPNSGRYCVVFNGVQLEEATLKEWLKKCAKQKPAKKQLRTIESLTKAETNRIHKQRHLEALPDGWFYNGAKFVSLAGDKEDKHPNLDQFLEDFLEKTNSEIQAYNAKIDKQEFQELFG